MPPCAGMTLPIAVFAAVGAAAAAAAAAAPGGWSETGEASWYGPRHAGLRTTSGETFDPSKLTAAHPSLPLGSFVRVTVVDSGRTVVVKVNDREPPHGVRCIDLSRAAAARLGIVRSGVADVTLETATANEATAEVAEAPEPALSAPHGRRHRHHGRR